MGGVFLVRLATFRFWCVQSIRSYGCMRLQRIAHLCRRCVKRAFTGRISFPDAKKLFQVQAAPAISTISITLSSRAGTCASSFGSGRWGGSMVSADLAGSHLGPDRVQVSPKLRGPGHNLGSQNRCSRLDFKSQHARKHIWFYAAAPPVTHHPAPPFHTALRRNGEVKPAAVIGSGLRVTFPPVQEGPKERTRKRDQLGSERLTAGPGVAVKGKAKCLEGDTGSLGSGCCADRRGGSTLHAAASRHSMTSFKVQNHSSV